MCFVCHLLVSQYFSNNEFINKYYIFKEQIPTFTLKSLRLPREEIDSTNLSNRRSLPTHSFRQTTSNKSQVLDFEFVKFRKQDDNLVSHEIKRLNYANLQGSIVNTNIDHIPRN